MTTQSTSIDREEMATVLKRHPGSMAEIANDLSIRAANVSNWLAGRMGSQRIEEAVIRKVRRLIAKETRELSVRQALPQLRS